MTVRGGRVDGFAGPRHLVEPLAGLVHRAVHGRHLLDLSDEARRDGAQQLLRIDGHGSFPHGRAARVARLRRTSEHERESVGFAPIFDQRDEARRAPSASGKTPAAWGSSVPRCPTGNLRPPGTE